MAYVYRHIRLDKNEPFYIGIGSDNKFKRAYSLKRNKFWHSIVNKTEYEIEILMDELSWEDANQKEKEFISLYGRKDLGTGTLVNLTDGGNGNIGAVRDKKFRQKVSKKMKGKKNALGFKHTEEAKRLIGEKISNIYWEKLYDEEYETAKLLGFAE